MIKLALSYHLILPPILTPTPSYLPFPSNFCRRLHHQLPLLRRSLSVVSKAKSREIILGNPSVTVEKGKYSYDVETLINKLSRLPPRGSIARCLNSFKNKLSLSDFSLVFKEFAHRGDWQRSLRLFKYMQRQILCKPNEHIYSIIIGILGRKGLLDKSAEIFDEMVTQSVPRTVLSYNAIINAYGRNGQYEVALELLEGMKKERILPNILTYNTIINSPKSSHPSSRRCCDGDHEQHKHSSSQSYSKSQHYSSKSSRPTPRRLRNGDHKQHNHSLSQPQGNSQRHSPKSCHPYSRRRRDGDHEQHNHSSSQLYSNSQRYSP